MNIIQTGSGTRFYLNGILYVRNFLSRILGDNIEIYNNYENKDILIEAIHFSQFTINGVVYSSAKETHEALTPIIYYRSTLNGDILPPISDQDNIGRVKIYTYTQEERNSPQGVNFVAKINALPSFTIDEKEDYHFVGAETSPNSLGLPSRTGNSIRHRFVNAGKGTYGQGGTPITINNLDFIIERKITVTDFLNDPSTQNIPYTLVDNQDISQWLNTQTPAIQLQDQSDGYRVFTGAQGTYFFLADGGLYGTGNLQSTMQDFELFGDELPAPPVNSVTGYGVDNTDPQNPVIKAPLPEDIFAAGSAIPSQIYYTAIRFLINDEFQNIRISDYITGLNRPVTEIARNGNDFYLIANSYSGTNESNPVKFVVMRNVGLLNGDIHVDDVSFRDVTLKSRVHGFTLHRGFCYLNTRPTTGQAGTVPMQIVKLNPNDFSYTKYLEIPRGRATDLIGYKNKLYSYVQYTGDVNASMRFIEVDENLNGYNTLFSYIYNETTNPKIATALPFLIYNDEIYIIHPLNKGDATKPFVGIYVYDFAGNLLRFNEDANINPNGRPIDNYWQPHWITQVNGKIIATPTDISTTGSNPKRWEMLRFDCQVLGLEEVYMLPNSITDDNTQFENGIIYLNGEGNTTSQTSLATVYYADFAGTFQKIVDNFYNSNAAINTAHLDRFVPKESLKVIPAADNTGVLRSLKVEVTQTGDTIQNDALIGADVHYIVARNAVQNTDFIFNNGTGTITNYPVEQGEIHYINYIKP